MRITVGLVLLTLIAVGVLFMINGVGLFTPSRKPRVQDDPEVLTGLVAWVSSAISAGGGGAVVYTLEGTRHEVAAKSSDGSPIQAGTDVVIERIENGTAVVERWETVEGRI